MKILYFIVYDNISNKIIIYKNEITKESEKRFYYNSEYINKDCLDNFKKNAYYYMDGFITTDPKKINKYKIEIVKEYINRFTNIKIQAEKNIDNMKQLGDKIALECGYNKGVEDVTIS